MIHANQPAPCARMTLPVLAAAAGLAALAPSAAADRMYAVDGATDSLYVFDSVTGQTLGVLGPLHADGGRYMTPQSMAVDPLGAIYVLNTLPASDAGLSRVNAMTGQATHIGGDVVGSIAFAPGGRLMGVGPDGRLGEVDKTTGNVTSLGGDVLPTLYGLDFNRRDGFLYGVSSDVPFGPPRLIKISPVTGRIFLETVMSQPTVGSVPGAIAFERDGDMIMTDLGRQLWEVDWQTGVMTAIAATTDIPQGLGMIPCVGDFNADGVLNIFDFLAFQNAFDARDRRADLDRDGELTIFDFLAFQNAFDAGC